MLSEVRFHYTVNLVRTGLELKYKLLLLYMLSESTLYGREETEKWNFTIPDLANFFSGTLAHTVTVSIYILRLNSHWCRLTKMCQG